MMRALALLALVGSSSGAAPTVSPQANCVVGLSSSKPIQCPCEVLDDSTLPWNNRPHKYCGKMPAEFMGAEHFTCPHCFQQGMQFNVSCPNSWAACEIFVLAYHCPGCSGPTNGGWVANLPGEGWRPSSCAPNFCVEGKGHPMVSLHKRVMGGKTAELPESATDPTMYFSLLVKQGKICEDIDSEGQCSGGLCRWEDGACVTTWCPPKGPDTPGQVCTPCAPKDCDAPPATAAPTRATAAPTRATAAPTRATAAPTRATDAPQRFTLTPQTPETAVPTKRVVSSLPIDDPDAELPRGGQ